MMWITAAPPRRGAVPVWVREVLAQHDIGNVDRILLLAQPRTFDHVFNPVSFWLCYTASNDLVCVIAEVSNTFGDRHSYLCHHADPVTDPARSPAQREKDFPCFAVSTRRRRLCVPL